MQQGTAQAPETPGFVQEIANKLNELKRPGESEIKQYKTWLQETNDVLHLKWLAEEGEDTDLRYLILLQAVVEACGEPTYKKFSLELVPQEENFSSCRICISPPPPHCC